MVGTRVAALIMWRAGETLVLEWREGDVRAVRCWSGRGKGGRGRTVPLHQDLASLFANWRTPYGPRDPSHCRTDPVDASASPAGRH